MSQLRSFSAFTNTAPVQPTLAGGVGQTTNFVCNLVNLDGTAAASGYLQIFDLAATASLSSGVTVPLKSFYVSAAGPLPSIFNSLGPISLTNGLVVAMSSTEAVYTAVATNYDVYGEIEEFEIDNTVGTTVVGDTTTARSSLTVWADDANGSKKTLRRLYVKNISGVDLFIVVNSSLTIPTQNGFSCGFYLANGASKTIHFGTSGLAVNNKSSAGVITQGCYIVSITTTGGYVDYLGTVANGINAKAWYATAS